MLSGFELYPRWVPLTRESPLELARQSEANVCRHKCNPLLIAQQTNNAQNTQHKLRVVFPYLERNKQNQEPWLLTEQINRFVALDRTD